MFVVNLVDLREVSAALAGEARSVSNTAEVGKAGE
jgi:hypothetical protein